MVVMRIKGSSTRAKPEEAITSRDSLAAQTAAFLKKGGEIEEIPRGLSGLSIPIGINKREGLARVFSSDAESALSAIQLIC